VCVAAWIIGTACAGLWRCLCSKLAGLWGPLTTAVHLRREGSDIGIEKPRHVEAYETEPTSSKCLTITEHSNIMDIWKPEMKRVQGIRGCAGAGEQCWQAPSSAIKPTTQIETSLRQQEKGHPRYAATRRCYTLTNISRAIAPSKRILLPCCAWNPVGSSIFGTHASP